MTGGPYNRLVFAAGHESRQRGGFGFPRSHACRAAFLRGGGTNPEPADELRGDRDTRCSKATRRSPWRRKVTLDQAMLLSATLHESGTATAALSTQPGTTTGFTGLLVILATT